MGASTLPLLLPFLLFSFLSSTFPHDLPETTATAVLDVSSSLQQARSVLSFQPPSPLSQLELSLPAFSNYSSSFSISLHPRESVLKSHHNDYKSLVQSRVHRDSARVHAISTRVQLVLTGIPKSDLSPSENEIQPEDLSTPATSGTSQGIGEYLSRVGVGSPAKQYYMVLDTGSDVNWIQCQPCSDCYKQSDPLFDPTDSSTYSPLACDSQQCNSLKSPTCRRGQCVYQVNYGDGSFTTGDFVTETLSFGRSGSVSNIALGCGHDNEGLFAGAAGVLGLGGGPLSITSQIKSTSFSYCLVNRDSADSSTLDFNASGVADQVVAPLLKNEKIETLYYVGLTGMSVGGHALPIPEEVFRLDESGRGGVIVDSGTAITRLPDLAYNLLRDAFVSMTPDLMPAGGMALFDTCYDFSGEASVNVPTVSFQFGKGKSWELPAENYLFPVDEAGTYCFAFAPTTSSLGIIGNVQQQGTRVTFDLANKVVGFSANKC